MKAVFLGLLLANILFLAWTSWHTPGGAAETAPAEPVPTLRLADEEGAGADKRTAARAPPAKPRESAPAGGSARCVTVGPFYDLPEASQASASLRGSGHESRTRVAEGDIWAGLWVYLEDLSSRAEAQRIMETLREHDITDAYLLPSATQGVDISLGIFLEPPRAQRRAAEVRKLGFSPTIAERTRRGTVYWLDVDLPRDGGTIDPSQLMGADEKERANGRIMRVEVKPCPAAAE